MKIAIFRFVLRAEQQVFEELFRNLICLMDTALQVIIISANERVAEIPRALRKHVVIHRKAEGFRILYDEYSDFLMTAPKGLTVAENHAICLLCTQDRR